MRGPIATPLGTRTLRGNTLATCPPACGYQIAAADFDHQDHPVAALPLARAVLLRTMLRRT